MKRYIGYINTSYYLEVIGGIAKPWLYMLNMYFMYSICFKEDTII